MSRQPARAPLTGHFRLRVGQQELDLQVEVPARPAFLDEMLPLFRQVANALVEVGVANAEASGERITCAKGCGACCRQAVPITAPEALDLVRTLKRWPEKRRRQVLARFDEVAARLASDSWIERWNTSGKAGARDTADIIRLGLEYFHLGQACPFLEDEACSIHPERPLICRQFLAINDPVFCRNPGPETVRTVSLPASVHHILGRLAREAGLGTDFLPLVLAPSFVADRASRGEARQGSAWAEALFKALSGKDLPTTSSPIMGG